AVDFDEGLEAAAGRLLMDEVGDQLFAGARFALDEDGRTFRERHLVDHLDDVANGGGFAEHQVPLRGLFAVGEVANLAAKATGFERVAERDDELGQPNGLGQVVEGAELQRLNGTGNVRVRGRHHDEGVDA